ncbi:MAG: hypothetical protein ACK559_30725, partial [bacterium]
SKRIKIENFHRYRIHKSRIRRLDPKKFECGTGFTKIQVTNTKRSTGFRKIQVTDTKRGTGFRKTQATDTKMKYRIQEKPRYQYKNEVTNTVLHKEKCDTYTSQN